MRHCSRQALVSRQALAGFAFAACLAGFPLPSQAASTVVKVVLLDPSVNSTIKGMEITAEPSTVKTGLVVFKVTNPSPGTIHEMIVVRPAADGKPMPYDAKTDRVNEDGIHSMGEVSERKPGEAGTLSVVLQPGSYLLMCNIAGHYKAGMWTTLTVTP